MASSLLLPPRWLCLCNNTLTLVQDANRCKKRSPIADKNDSGLGGRSGWHTAMRSLTDWEEAVDWHNPIVQRLRHHHPVSDPFAVKLEELGTSDDKNTRHHDMYGCIICIRKDYLRSTILYSLNLNIYIVNVIFLGIYLKVSRRLWAKWLEYHLERSPVRFVKNKVVTHVSSEFTSYISCSC